MSLLTADLQTTLTEVDSDTAIKLERLVRDAMALVRAQKQAGHMAVDSNGWPVDHFEQYAGALAGDNWSSPADPPPEPLKTR